MNWFLRAKHWHIFMLILVIPIVLEIISMIGVIITNSPVPIFVVFPIMMFSVIYGQFGWMYTIGTKLQEKLPPEGRMNVKRFKTFMLIPVVYIIVLILYIGLMAIGLSGGGRPSGFAFLPFIIIIPMHFFSLFCIFYGLWFVAKSLKTVELWRQVDFGDYVGEFFLIWFFFIGIWFIQPKINRMFPEHQNPEIS